MNFDEVHALIPFVRAGKKHSIVTKLSDHVEARQPGVHANVTNGGDAVIVVSDNATGWKAHQFKHDDIFLDIEAKAWDDTYIAFELMEAYLGILQGKEVGECFLPGIPGLDANTFLVAVQALAVIEHRRYAQHEAAWGGRFLPFRFSAGIAERRWSAGNAIMLQKRGRPGVEQLEAKYGVPYLTQKLMTDV